MRKMSIIFQEMRRQKRHWLAKVTHSMNILLHWQILKHPLLPMNPLASRPKLAEMNPAPVAPHVAIKTATVN